MKLKYKFMLVIVTILLLSTLTIGSSYSLWLSNSTQIGENTMNIGCFNLTFEDSDFHIQYLIVLDVIFTHILLQ